MFYWYISEENYFDINNEQYVGQSLVLDLVRLGAFCGGKINN